MTIKVFLADDQAMVRAGFAMVIAAQDDMEVIGEAAEGAEALARLAVTAADVVLMDVRMPRMDGVEATRRLLARPTGRSGSSGIGGTLKIVGMLHRLMYRWSGGRIGHARHPAWYLNLRANLRVSIRMGGKTRTMVARSAEGSERAELWERLVQQYPVAVEYQRRTSREIPMVVLRPEVSPYERPGGNT